MHRSEQNDPIGSTLKMVSIQITFILTVLALAITSTQAEQSWTVSRLTGDTIPNAIFSDTREKAVAGLPDGLIATNEDRGDIQAAWYGSPTQRYGHGILGDRTEAGELIVKLASGGILSLVLPNTEVFEDRAPRLVDLDGDGSTEVITIRSSLSKGASVTLYSLSDGKLIERATTGFIGRAYRWLNIAGIARFLGSQSKEIAFVRTPHIGGTLFIYRYGDGQLRKVTETARFLQPPNRFQRCRSARSTAWSRRTRSTCRAGRRALPGSATT